MLHTPAGSPPESVTPFFSSISDKTDPFLSIHEANFATREEIYLFSYAKEVYSVME